MKKNNWIYAILVVTSLAWVACDEDDNPLDKPDLNGTDETFVEFAARSNMAEIEMGELAATKATNAEVKSFAQDMISEHSTAQDELEDIADDFGNVEWPNDLNEEHDSIMAVLNDAEGGIAFDTLYMRTQIVLHQGVEQNFRNATTNTTDARVKAYATKYHPHIEMHLEKADSIQGVIAITTAAGGTADATGGSGGTGTGTGTDTDTGTGTDTGAGTGTGNN